MASHPSRSASAPRRVSSPRPAVSRNLRYSLATHGVSPVSSLTLRLRDIADQFHSFGLHPPTRRDLPVTDVRITIFGADPPHPNEIRMTNFPRSEPLPTDSPRPSRRSDAEPQTPDEGILSKAVGTNSKLPSVNSRTPQDRQPWASWVFAAHPGRVPRWPCMLRMCLGGPRSKTEIRTISEEWVIAEAAIRDAVRCYEL